MYICISGSAYVYSSADGITAWTQQSQLLASDGSAGDVFGISVSVYGNIIVVGAYGDDTAGGTNAGIYNHMNTIQHNINQSINQ